MIKEYKKAQQTLSSYTKMFAVHMVLFLNLSDNELHCPVYSGIIAKLCQFKAGITTCMEAAFLKVLLDRID